MDSINDYKKGDAVTFGGKVYTIQEDKGWLHIVKRDEGKRRKYDLQLVLELNDLETVEGWERLYQKNYGVSNCNSIQSPLRRSV